MLSSVPYIAVACLSPSLGYALDVLIKRHYCSIGTARKIGNTIGMVGPAICLIILGYITEHIVWSMIMLMAGLVLECGHGSGSFINHMDLSPRFAGFLSGVTATATDLLSPAGPLLVGYIVTDKVSCNSFCVYACIKENLISEIHLV